MALFITATGSWILFQCAKVAMVPFCFKRAQIWILYLGILNTAYVFTLVSNFTLGDNTCSKYINNNLRQQQKPKWVSRRVTWKTSEFWKRLNCFGEIKKNVFLVSPRNWNQIICPTLYSSSGLLSTDTEGNAVILTESLDGLGP